jgi:predicted transcriptional regulator
MEFSSRELPGLYFRKVIRDDMGEISFDSAMVRLFVAIDENKAIAQVAKEIGMNLATVRENLLKLVKLGVVVQVEKVDQGLGPYFLNDLRTNMAQAVGPMADVLIEEVLEAMQLSTSYIPKHVAAELINNLARQIPREDKRIAFQQTMIARVHK